MKRIFNVLIMSSFIFLSCNATSGERQQPTPEQQQKMMQQSMNAMVPFMGQMMKVMMKVQFEVLSDPNTAQQLATYTKNYYEALIKKGFTKEESLKIAMNMGIPSLPSMQK